MKMTMMKGMKGRIGCAGCGTLESPTSPLSVGVASSLRTHYCTASDIPLLSGIAIVPTKTHLLGVQELLLALDEGEEAAEDGGPPVMVPVLVVEPEEEGSGGGEAAVVLPLLGGGGETRPVILPLMLPAVLEAAAVCRGTESERQVRDAQENG